MSTPKLLPGMESTTEISRKIVEELWGTDFPLRNLELIASAIKTDRVQWAGEVWRLNRELNEARAGRENWRDACRTDCRVLNREIARLRTVLEKAEKTLRTASTALKASVAFLIAVSENVEDGPGEGDVTEETIALGNAASDSYVHLLSASGSGSLLDDVAGHIRAALAPVTR